MRRDFLKMNKGLLFLTIIMFIFGLFMIFSASSVQASLSGEPYQYFIKQALTLVICLFVSYVIICIPLKFYRKLTPLIMYGVIGSFIIVYLYGSVVNNSKAWMPIGFYNFQPSEFAKTAIIMYLAFYYNKNKDSKNIVTIFYPVVPIIAICVLVVLQPDIGTLAIIGLLSLAIFFAVPFEKQIRKALSQVLVLAVAITIIFTPILYSHLSREQLERLDYQRPCTKYLKGGSGYQVCNSFIAINNGGLWGVGIGNSTQKYLYLPAAHTDFIFAIILEETGLIISLCIISLYILIIIIIMRIALRSYNLTGAIISYGTAVYIFLHIFTNLVGVLGLLPLTGVPLPFLSYGGSYAFNLAILLALVQRVNIENKYKQQERLLKEGN